jgi:LCP family protein required for cell wall assembly
MWRAGALLLLGVAAWAGFGYVALNGAVGESNARITAGATGALSAPRGGILGTPQNTLIIGSDGRVGETRARADTILIMRTDPERGRISWLSIPRDFRVDIPGLGEQKINSAFFFAGQKGIINAVRRLTGLPIHHIIVVNFRGFPRLVDELGGVTVSNPTRLVNCAYPGGTTVSFARGRIDLDGARALQFARVRNCDDDFRRAGRQQALVAGLKERVLSPAGVPTAPWRGAAVVRALSTDLSTFDLIKLGWLQARLTQTAADRVVLSGTPRLIGGQSFVVGDPDANEREVARFLGRRASS